MLFVFWLRVLCFWVLWVWCLVMLSCLVWLVNWWLVGRVFRGVVGIVVFVFGRVLWVLCVIFLFLLGVWVGGWLFFFVLGGGGCFLWLCIDRGILGWSWGVRWWLLLIWCWFFLCWWVWWLFWWFFLCLFCVWVCVVDLLWCFMWGWYFEVVLGVWCWLWLYFIFVYFLNSVLLLYVVVLFIYSFCYI